MSIKATAAALDTDPGKAERVKAEQARLMGLFTGADKNKLNYISIHVQQLAWLGVSILDLQSQIDAEGTVIPYQNGRNQTGLQANPAAKLLIDCQKLYNTVFRALMSVLPEENCNTDDFDLDLDNV